MECCYVPIAILVALASGAQPHPIRRLSEGVLISSADPPLRFRPDAGFSYLGKVPIRIDDIATGERHVFVDGEGQHVRRLLILQFEGFLPGVNDYYKYPMRNPIKLAGETYTRGTFIFSNAASQRAAPGLEADVTLRFLKARGYQPADAQMTARFARVVDERRRHEFIIFYQEAAADHGLTMDRDTTSNGDLKPEQASQGDALMQRAAASFSILPPKTR